MATWQEIAEEITASNPDTVRRSKLAALQQLTGRPVILYAVDMFNRPKIQSTGGDISIDLSDKTGFTEALRGLEGTELDVVLHSPGGSPEATESIVHLLRDQFHDIHFIIPNIAKSAATMLAMSGDKIILGDNAELGPTDPQMVINGRFNPAHAIIKQFGNAKEELSKSNEALPAWLPILQQYGPSLLVDCENAIDLTHTLVKDWVKKYMLKDDNNKARKANNISKFLGNKKHLSHGRMIRLDELKEKGVKAISASECIPNLSEVIQDINYATLLTFNMTGAYKLFESHLGPGMYKMIQQPIQLPVIPGATPQR
jgi:hypothetical protein